MITAQAHYDAATPYSVDADRIADRCSELADALHESLQVAGFDVDGIECEPCGEHEILVSCSPFPAISIVCKSVGDMCEEWAKEIGHRLIVVNNN